MPFSFKTKLCSDRKHLRTVLIRKTIEYELTFVDTTSPQEFNLIVQSRLKQRIQFQNNSRTHIFNEILSKKKKRRMNGREKWSVKLEPAEIYKIIQNQQRFRKIFFKFFFCLVSRNSAHKFFHIRTFFSRSLIVLQENFDLKHCYSKTVSNWNHNYRTDRITRQRKFLIRQNETLIHFLGKT